MANIVLIGMPGCSKEAPSACCLQKPFKWILSIRIIFCSNSGEKAQEIIDQVGNDAFLKMEEDCVRGA